jgi:acyl-coenzyme A synthetase/AMP-(fatty) acid ligase
MLVDISSLPRYLFLSHELVEDGVVTGIPDEYPGALSKAFIILKTGTKRTDKLAQNIQK